LIAERPFTPVPPEQLSVFDGQHPRPLGGMDALRKHMTDVSDKQMAALRPKNAGSLKEFRRVVGTALRVMIHDTLPAPADVEAKTGGTDDQENVRFQRLSLGRKGLGEEIPAVLVSRPSGSGKVVVWIHPAGKSSLLQHGKLVPAAREILDKGASVLAVDVFLTGEFSAKPPAEVNASYAGYTFGYNRPVLANRVHDILTAVAYARGLKETKTVDLAGFRKAGPWVLLARGLCGEAVNRTVVDADQFRFDKVQTTTDEMMLPGALKYGGLPAFAALCAPGDLYLYNSEETGIEPFARDAYQASGATGHLQEYRVVEWLLR
jgi:hypothetical protein